jgi:predicted XRE-type DNA-binding protein
MAGERSDEVVVLSSGNVFADLGLKNSDGKQPKVRLAVAINEILRQRRLSQVSAARLLRINQPKISSFSKLP